MYINRLSFISPECIQFDKNRHNLLDYIAQCKKRSVIEMKMALDREGGLQWLIIILCIIKQG